MIRRRSFLLSVAAYLLITFPLGYAWHLVAFGQVYEELGVYTRPEPIVPLGFLSTLLQGVLLALAYPRFRRDGGSPVRDGLRFGLFAGAFGWTYLVVVTAAHQTMSSLATWLTLETLFVAVQFTLVGLAFGIAYRRGVRSMGRTSMREA